MTESQPARIARMGSIVYDVPDPKASARFWNGVTGGETTSSNDEWVSTRTPDGWNLNFQRASDLVPAQWPGQEHPQQLHLDLSTADVAGAVASATGQGATVLAEEARWTTLADLSGHTFDLCVGEGSTGTTLTGVTFDVPDAHAAVQFWSALIGESVAFDQDGMGMTGGDRPIMFQQIENYTPPQWPDPRYPQQGHLDVYVDDLDAAEKATLELGATRLKVEGEGEDFRVFADPAGHPFCLCLTQGSV